MQPYLRQAVRLVTGEGRCAREEDDAAHAGKKDGPKRRKLMTDTGLILYGA